MNSTDTLMPAAIGVAGFATLIAIIALLVAFKSRKQLRVLRGTDQEIDLLDANALQGERIDELTLRVAKLSNAVAIAQRDVAASLRHLAVVRFNAMSDMGGQFSFSAAILDDNGNGIVISSIQGHNQSRLYSKLITNRQSEQPLSPEEKQAIDAATPQENR